MKLFTALRQYRAHLRRLTLRPPAKPGRRRTDICPDLARAVFHSTHEGLIIVDATGHVVSANEAFSRLTGYSSSAICGQNLLAEHVVARLYPFLRPMMQAFTGADYWTDEVWITRQDGRQLALRLSVSAIRGGRKNASYYVALLSDTTEFRKGRQDLERVAYHDALTQLPNRLLLAKRAPQAIALARTQQQRMAVAFIDLDGFKAVNDSHGHDLGDRVLQTLARRLKGTIRDSDTLARIGGDEFVATLSGLQTPEECKPLLERMIESASKPIIIDGTTVQVSASIGVAFFPEHGQTIQALINRADEAMYSSKRLGGKRLVFCGVQHLIAE